MHLVCDLAAVAVDSVADTVDEQPIGSVDRYRRKVLQVLGNLVRTVLGIFAEVIEEVITGSACEEVDLVLQFRSADVVDEVVEASVSAHDDDLVLFLELCKESLVVLDIQDADIVQLLTCKDLIELSCLFLTGVPSGLGVEKNVIHNPISFILLF